MFHNFPAARIFPAAFALPLKHHQLQSLFLYLDGGPDPENNSKLRDVIAKAKANNMPFINILKLPLLYTLPLFWDIVYPEKIYILHVPLIPIHI